MPLIGFKTPEGKNGWFDSRSVAGFHDSRDMTGYVELYLEGVARPIYIKATAAGLKMALEPLLE